ncbi:MAG TPA: hypothetical protein RMH99_02245 [Sandaracinaceae bacterium LLY-WYZ-13_1]|nr:hypothetical protein [Sandaracinaceae bacterium LLY-WYZ-13_1]
MAKPKKIVEVERREIPPHERVILRYSAPVGTRALYRQVAALEGLQHEVWVRDALHRAARAVLEEHGLDTGEMPDAHFPRPPRIQPRYDVSGLTGESPWARRRKHHRRPEAGDDDASAPRKKKAAKKKRASKKKRKTRGGRK